MSIRLNDARSAASWPPIVRRPGPPRWKIATLTWLGIFPSITIILAACGSLLANLPLVARTFVLTLILAPAMTFVIMPFLTKSLAGWLHSSKRT